ncbi:MAG TPA: type II toxin-antitoxin system RelE/ParE family toxin [Chlorobaculum sp.]|nr:type II toxin-antitoxin system RelE/ParE family toxin [Chlorobaculum sp.]
MKFTVRLTPEAKDDLVRLYKFLLKKDLYAAEEALGVLSKGIDYLREFPFSCRKVVPENPLLRELLVSFGNYGYVALFEIEDNKTISIIAVRHQREDDYY